MPEASRGALARPARPRLLHLAVSGQAYRATVLVFLDVVPDKLVRQPCSLPGRQFNILGRQTMADCEAGTTLVTGHRGHDNDVRCGLTRLPYTFGDSVACRDPDAYHRGSRG